MVISKEILAQYNSMKAEIVKCKAEFQKTEDSIAKLIAEGTVQDKVKGGLGGIQGFKIEGFPIAIYERRKRLLELKANRLAEKENNLLEIVEKIENCIDTIPVSRDRLIFKAIYLEEKTQQEIANELHIDRSLVSKIISKYV